MNKHANQNGEAIAIWSIVGVVVVALGVLEVVMHLGHAIAGTEVHVPANPFEIVLLLTMGDLAWPGAAGWIILAGLVLLVGVLIGGAARLWRSRRGGPSRVDNASKEMGKGRDIADLSRRAAQAKADRLGVAGAVGVPIGRTVAGNRPLYGSWEDMHCDIWGPRTGKTMSRAIPATLEAPGAVLATSNKRDLVDATRGPRSAKGRVWVFDPQDVAQEEPTWWWNPLTYVTDEQRAKKLAEHFAAGTRTRDSRQDSFFDTTGQNLLADLLLAAAVANKPITQVYTWLNRETDETAADILREADYPLIADELSGIITSPDKQRGGIFGTARTMASCLTIKKIARWVTPNSGVDKRAEFNPEDFVRSTDTLYSLSKEGAGNAGPLVTALTVAVCEAAEERAARSPHGRLTTPMVGVLDEAANVCRWADLPAQYSHFGSRGIVLMTILQSWSQGCEVWGEAGMKKLWSAANVKVYGGGVQEMAFLDDLSKAIDEYDRYDTSISNSRQGRSTSRQSHRQRVMSAGDLAALPRGRAVVMGSGSRPTLIRTIPWTDGPHAQEVEASIKKYEPPAESPEPVWDDNVWTGGPLA